MTRRAFTLLETMMASLIGMLLLISVIGLFGAIDTTERRLNVRYVDSIQMGRLQAAMQRALTMLVMDGVDTTAIATGASEAPAPEPEENPDKPAARPRFILNSVPDADAPSGSVQRLEVVVALPPISLSRRGADMLAMAARATEGQLDRLREEAEDGPGQDDGRTRSTAVRGAFELHAATREDALYDTLAGAVPAGYTVWWVPSMTERERLEAEESGADLQGRHRREGVPILTGIRQFRWQAFDEGPRKATYSALDFMSLPSYVELEVATVNGSYANWMFEISYRVGPDPAAPPEEPSPDPEGGDEGDGDEAGDPAGEDGT